MRGEITPLVKLFVAGFIVSLASAAAMVVLLAFGDWSPDTAQQRLETLGSVTLLLICMAGLFGGGALMAGPLQHLSIKAGPVELDASGDGADDEDAPNA